MSEEHHERDRKEEVRIARYNVKTKIGGICSKMAIFDISVI